MFVDLYFYRMNSKVMTLCAFLALSIMVTSTSANIGEDIWDICTADWEDMVIENVVVFRKVSDLVHFYYINKLIICE